MRKIIFPLAVLACLTACATSTTVTNPDGTTSVTTTAPSLTKAQAISDGIVKAVNTDVTAYLAAANVDPDKAALTKEALANLVAANTAFQTIKSTDDKTAIVSAVISTARSVVDLLPNISDGDKALIDSGLTLLQTVITVATAS